jgi:glycosyltransferase involved in cell wall biosynthesis
MIASSLPDRVAIVAARNEAERIAATIGSLRRAMPGILVYVANDASTDGTGEVALAAGATVIARGRPHGKGGNMTAAAEAALSALGTAPEDGAQVTFLLCDGDLGDSAALLAPLVEEVERGHCDLAIASFARKVGGGIGLTKGFARRAIERACGLVATEPISGQRAMGEELLRELLPFATGFGMETGMTIDAVRAGARVRECELDLSHRATGKTLGGFLHRGRQLRDIASAYVARRRG